jgi:hypothetical protein
VPQQMSPQDVLRELRRIRFSPTKGRRINFSWLARQAGYSTQSLYRSIHRGWLSHRMASRLSGVFQKTTTLSTGQVAPSNPLDAGSDPRGRPRLAGPRYPCGKLRPRSDGERHAPRA